MEYNVHGTVVEYDKECGQYYMRNPDDLDYDDIDKSLFVFRINNKSKEEAIKFVTGIKNIFITQLSVKKALDIARSTNYTGIEPTPINKVRRNLENTVEFTERILEALSE